MGKKGTVRDVQRKGELLKDFDLGPVAFNFPITKLADRASGEVFSSADGLDSSVFAQAPLVDPFTPRSAKGGEAHLDEYQTYEKQPGAGRASLRITISGLSLETEDANGPLRLLECPALGLCYPIQTIVRSAHTYTRSAQRTTSTIWRRCLYGRAPERLVRGRGDSGGLARAVLGGREL